MSDLEHDSQEDGPPSIGQTPPRPPDLTDKQLDREEKRDNLRERRKRDKEPDMPKTREAMLAQRYKIIPDRPQQQAAQEEWLSFHNEELWTRL